MDTSDVQYGNMEKDIRIRVQPLIKLLDAPDNLAEFTNVVAEFSSILELYRPLSRPPETAKIDIIEQIINEVVNGNIPVSSIIDSARPDKKRQTLKPHYQKNPHYCVYWHKSSNIGLQPQYRALLASFLPIQTKLQSTKVLESHPFEEIAYLVGMCLRQLSAPNIEEEKILRELPREALPPASLRIRLQELYARYNHNFRVTGELKNFGYLYRVLNWFESGIWEQRLKESQKSSSSRESPRHGGGLFNNSIEFVQISSHTQEDGENLLIRKFHTESTEVENSIINNIDIDPIEDSAKVSESVEIPPQKATEFNLIDRIALSRRKAHYVAQAIEMSNQNLPISRSVLTGYELKILLKSLSEPIGSEWSKFSQVERFQIATWGACRFFIGREPDVLKDMHVPTDKHSSKPCHITLNPDCKTIWLPCQHPRHKPPSDLSKVFVPSPGFTLNIESTLAPYFQQRSSKSHKIFPQNFEDKFVQLLRNLNNKYGTSLTPNRVSNCIAGLITLMAPNDEVMATYFSGRTPNQHNPSVYSAVPAARISSLFDQACKRIFELSDLTEGMTKTPDFPNLLQDEDAVVGSMHVPKLETLQKTISNVLAKLEVSKNTPGTPVHELHNAYTAYVLLFALATTAIRGVKKPIPAWFDMDKTTGSCFISEKDNDAYGNSRIVWLHPTLVKQFDEYARHTTKLRQYLALVNLHSLKKFDAQKSTPLLSSVNRPNRSEDIVQLQNQIPALFMLSDYGGHPSDILPNHVVEILGDSWQLKLVSLRHFVRTQLLLNGCSGIQINALLGHGERGQSPWGDFSTLPPNIWRKQLAEHLAPILNQMGFKVVASPLLRS